MADELTERQKRSLEAMKRVRARAESGKLGRFDWRSGKRIATKAANSLIVDSSVALSWVYTDEFSASTRSLLEKVSLSGAWGPMVWHLEIVNSLQTSLRRGRIDRVTRDQAIFDLTALNISTDPDTIAFAWTATLALAERFRLTAYDACYLELAYRRSLPLATFDEELHATGRRLDIELPGL